MGNPGTPGPAASYPSYTTHDSPCSRVLEHATRESGDKWGRGKTRRAEISNFESRRAGRVYRVMANGIPGVSGLSEERVGHSPTLQ